MPPPTHRPRSVLACAAAAVTVLLAAVGAVPALAITSSGGAGRPGEAVAVELVNERPQQGPWLVRAPAGTTFAATPSVQGGGSSRSSCVVVDTTETRCVRQGRWPAGSRLRARLAIAHTAPAGGVTAISTVGEETAGYTITVLPPPPPTLRVPATTRDRTPTLSGTREVLPGSGGPGHSVTVTDADGRRLCAVPAGNEAAWSCTSQELPLGESVLVARQTSPGGSTSPASDPSVVRVVADVGLDHPVDGSSTFARAITVSGTADPGSEVRVTLSGRRTVASVSDRGRFTVDFDDLLPGRHRVTAEQRPPGGPPSRASIDVLVRELDPPTVSDPPAGSRTQEQRPLLRGRGEPTARVEVDLAGQRHTVQVDRSGRWSLRPAHELPLGTHQLLVHQTVDGVDSTATRSPFTVVPPPPQQPAPRPAPSPPAEQPGGPVPEPTPERGPVPEPSEPEVTDPQRDPGQGQPPTPAPGPVPEPSEPEATDPQRDPGQGQPPTPAPGPVPEPSELDAAEPEGEPGGRRPPTPQRGPVPEPSGPEAAEPQSEPGGGQPTRTGEDSADRERPGKDEGPTTSPSPDGTPPPGGGAWSTTRLMPVSLTTASVDVVPGTASRMSGRIGPNPSDETVTVTVDGHLTGGVRYRGVSLLEGGGRCSVDGDHFQCRVELGPAEEATLAIAFLADAAARSDHAVQRLHVSGDGNGAGDGPGAVNAVTSVLDLTGGAPTDTETLARKVSEFPGSFVVVLALFLFALAATLAERGR
ncbi:hypothetical protein [Desertihabitans aurantiacus]|uniref:hypothetical protein n=1 Tax=Desertihabitans aurantiacus TaxID=2282477 RepID=UPI000DF74A64|nr:hypothetical protein [Desertihabitans aurantiacus]